MKKLKSISFILSTKGTIPSVNNLYKAMIKQVGSKRIPVIYKDPSAKKVIEELTEQLRMIDFSKEDWLFEKDAIFDLNIQLIFKQSFGRRDTDNTIKLIQDSVFRHIGLNDSRVINVNAAKSICESLSEEKICINISQSRREIHFDKLEELPVPSRIFLGGTCNGSTWRNDLMPELTKLGYDYFNPVVPDWTPEMKAIEDDEKNNKCDGFIYVITPDMTGVYSIAEIINSAHETKQAGYGCCLFGLLGNKEDYGENQWRSLMAVIDMTNKIGNGSKRVWAGQINNSTDLLNHLGVPKKKRKSKT